MIGFVNENPFDLYHFANVGTPRNQSRIVVCRRLMLLKSYAALRVCALAGHEVTRYDPVCASRCRRSIYTLAIPVRSREESLRVLFSGGMIQAITTEPAGGR
jgi:hypothetical protein